MHKVISMQKKPLKMLKSHQIVHITRIRVAALVVLNLFYSNSRMSGDEKNKVGRRASETDRNICDARKP